MLSDVSVVERAPVVELFQATLYEPSIESSESVFEFYEPESEDGPKMKLFKEGLYRPGSGELCAKYIAMSDSSVLRHPYYNYPAIIDPGIEQALYYPEKRKIYPKDGQELYLDLCKEMNLIPCRLFHRGLMTDEINLKYYGVNPTSMRAMSMALAQNITVKRLDLTSNFLDTRDACYHLGQMLGDRNAIKELVLSQCKLGNRYLNQVLLFLYTRKMDLLDLSENGIGNTGYMYLNDQIFQGARIKRLSLRGNGLTSESLLALAEVLEFHDHTENLDLSWNVFYETEGPIRLIRALRQSKVLVELNLSYTGLCVGIPLGALLRIQTLKVLNLSHNRLSTRGAKILAKNLYLAKSLEVLDISCNPFTPQEALEMLLTLKDEEVNVKELLMDTIEVSKEFPVELKAIRKLEYRQNTVITYGVVHADYTLGRADMKIIFVKQLVRLSIPEKKKEKKKKKEGAPEVEEEPFDLLVWLLEQQKTRKDLQVVEFLRIMKRNGCPIQDQDFVLGLTKAFPGTQGEKKLRPINLNMVADYIHRVYPEKKPPPTPPPSLPSTPRKKKGRGKKKGVKEGKEEKGKPGDKGKGDKAKGDKGKGDKAKGGKGKK